MEALVDPSPRPVLARTLRLHAWALPLWALRVAADPLRNGTGIYVLIALDVCLTVWHWRANRLSDKAYPDWYGGWTSWTRLLYMPELLALFFTIHDGWRAFAALSGRPF